MQVILNYDQIEELLHLVRSRLDTLTYQLRGSNSPIMQGAYNEELEMLKQIKVNLENAQ